MKVQTRFIEPLDVLNFRGNKSFGEGGQHGVSQMPPRPSIFAGALRSWWLAMAGVDLQAFAEGKAEVSAQMQAQLGTPQAPGSFRVQALWLARQKLKQIELLMPLPADVLVLEKGVERLRPQVLPDMLSSSAVTSHHAVLCAKAEKPQTGLWLDQEGIKAWLQGTKPDRKHLVSAASLWQTDHRLGIALDATTHTVEEGHLYTTESVAIRPGVGFITQISGAGDLPASGMLRLGGDGRAAKLTSAEVSLPEPDWKRIEKDKRFRLILATPGIFSGGWRLPGDQDGSEVKLGEGKARLACAAVSRFEVISGWNLAGWHPKDAERITPAGSVYWLDNYTGSITNLRNLLSTGIGMDNLDPQRRAEGFNNILIANWID